VLAIPFDQVFNKWGPKSRPAAPGHVRPNVTWARSRAALLGPVDASLLGGALPDRDRGMTVEGKLWAVPESLKAVALYYNRSRSRRRRPRPTSCCSSQDSRSWCSPEPTTFGFWSAFGGLLRRGRYLRRRRRPPPWVPGRAEKPARANRRQQGGDVPQAADMIINGRGRSATTAPTSATSSASCRCPPARQACRPLTGVDGWYVSERHEQESAVNLACS
jgi:hypothetical protein